MGTSNWQQIGRCIEIIQDIQPKSILDIGVGFGRWGMLSREFLELWNNRTNSIEWKVKIDGVEVFDKNIEGWHNYFYNNIYNVDAYDYVMKTEDKYDLIIFGDVLEHFEKEKAIEIIKRCLEFGKYILINLPLGTSWKQDDLYNNIYEKHLSIWSLNDFKRFPVSLKVVLRDHYYRKYGIIVLSKEKINKNYNIKKIIKYHWYQSDYIRRGLKYVLNKLHIINK